MTEDIPKEEQRILVVSRKDLFGIDNGRHFQGFKEHGEENYEALILDGQEIMRRGSDKEPVDHPEGNAERSLDCKQPIGYMLVVNPEARTVFAFQRATKPGAYGETRLYGKRSWGVGGHIEPEDGQDNPLRESRLRELQEEIAIDGDVLRTNILGYINYEDDDVSKVHFGVLYLVEIKGVASSNSEEMAFGEMLDISELERRIASESWDVEPWSKIALEPLKKYFG